MNNTLEIAESYNLIHIRCKAWNAIGNVNHKRGSYKNALEYFEKAIDGNEKLGDKLAVAIVYGNLGNLYKDLGSYDKSLEFFEKALAIYKEFDDTMGISRVYGGIGIVYSLIGSYEMALEYYRKALVIHEKLEDKSSIANVFGLIGTVYAEQSSYQNALEYLSKAAKIQTELGEKSRIAGVLANIGGIHWNLASYDTALEYFSKALVSHQELGEKSWIANDMANIGLLYSTKNYEGYDISKAEDLFRNAIEICQESGSKGRLFFYYKSLADLYESENRWEDAFVYLKRYIEIKDEVQSEEAKKKAALMEQQKQAAEREKEIAIANAKHVATEELLHNVLPPSIANKMLSGSKLIAEKLSNVSVLFADIVDFTKLSQRETPEELVEGLDRIFTEFDTLAEKYGLEKIKTIGDAYMVVSGAPEPREDHAEVMVHFAVEMLEVMKQFRSISTGEQIQLRIGIHTGEVVAGVIGKKKFAYDMWGDAVNTAARMESHGEPDRIHVSEDFRNSAGDGFTFTERGETDIKGKGMMKTFFL